MPDFSDNSLGDADAEAASLLEEAALLGSSAAAPGSAIDLQLAQGFLELMRWEGQSSHFHRGNPSLHTGEAIFGMMAPFLARSLSEDEGVESAIARMSAVPAFLERAREAVSGAPPEWSRRAARECDGALAFLNDGWRSLPGAGRHEGRLHKAASHAATAFAEHRVHLQASTQSQAVHSVGAGQEAFERYLTRGHFLSQTADDIVAYATDEMARAKAALIQGASAMGSPDPEQALAALSSLHPEVDRYYARYGELWDQTRAVAEQQELVTWPDFPIEYVPRPEWAREAAPNLYFLYYRSPAAVNRPKVHRYLVTPIESSMDPGVVDDLLRANNDSVIKLNHVLHHGSIGHHVQNWNAFRAESRVGRVAAVDCASRIALYCGLTMAEGWACYATSLMSEFGMLTELEQLAETRSRVRMCARAIVDVELHTKDWTLDQAAAFYRSQAGMSEAAANNEAVKNSMFPGAALIYLMGSDGIRDLRSDLEQSQGSEFSLRRFHDTFLSYGSIPVSIVADRMRRSDHVQGDK